MKLVISTKSLFSHLVRKAVPWPVSCSRDCAPVE